MQVITMNSDRAMRGYALAKDEGEAFSLFGMLQTVKIGRADTSGGFGLLEIVVPSGHGSPWHVHPEEDEWFYVLEGNLTVYVGDTRLDLEAGGLAYGPKGVPHTFIGVRPQPHPDAGGFFTDAVRGIHAASGSAHTVTCTATADGWSASFH